MIVRSAAPVSILITFDNGFPDANVDYVVYDEAGTALKTDSVVVPAGSVSISIPIPSIVNTLPVNGLTGYRDVEWSYTSNQVYVTGDQRYSLQGRIPYGVSPDGVRSKLGGISPVDLPDSDIELAASYITFKAIVTDPVLAAAPTDDLTTLLLRDAIEAQAAYVLVPTMAVRVASKESSGTDSFTRQAIDWQAIADRLSDTIDAGIGSLVPDYDPTLTWQPMFVLASPSIDSITNAAPDPTNGN